MNRYLFKMRNSSATICQLGNIFTAIPDRDFALLVYNSEDCRIHLIFSNQTNAEKLNQFEFTDSLFYKVPRGWISLYKSKKDGVLKPVLTMASFESQLTCAAESCNRLVHDPITGTNRFDCDLTKSCSVTFDSSNEWHLYVNDPNTNVLNVIANTKYSSGLVYIGRQNISSNGTISPLAMHAFNNEKNLNYWTFAYDTTKNVKYTRKIA